MSSNSMQQQQLQQSTGSPRSHPVLAGVVPQGPGGALPVDTFGRSTRSVQEGGEMRGNTFVTSRGDQISRPHGHHPQQGQISGTYPKIDKVSERI